MTEGELLAATRTAANACDRTDPRAGMVLSLSAHRDTRAPKKARRGSEACAAVPFKEHRNNKLKEIKT